MGTAIVRVGKTRSFTGVGGIKRVFVCESSLPRNKDYTMCLMSEMTSCLDV